MAPLKKRIKNDLIYYMVAATMKLLGRCRAAPRSG